MTVEFVLEAKQMFIHHLSNWSMKLYMHAHIAFFILISQCHDVTYVTVNDNLDDKTTYDVRKWCEIFSILNLSHYTLKWLNLLLFSFFFNKLIKWIMEVIKFNWLVVHTKQEQ